MDVKAVLHNLVTKGPLETYGIHYYNKRKAEEIKQSHGKKAVGSRKLSIKKIKADLKSVMLKEYFPKVYEEVCAQTEVENKIIVLQPKSNLNSSCKYLYHYLEDHTDYEVKFIELNHNEVSEMDYYYRCYDFIKELASAKAVICHEQVEMIGQLKLREGSEYINVWHGLPLKKLRYSLAGMKGYKSIEGFKEYPESNYDLVPLASEEWKGAFAEFMNLPKDSKALQPLGVPRTDEFFDKEKIEKSRKKLYKRIPAAIGKKIILYAPTYRGLEPHREAPDVLDVAKFAEALSDDYILIVKYHQTLNEWPQLPEEYKGTFAYDMSRKSGMDINELMSVSDILITDYSSLLFDFALFDRPILFFAFDYEDYADERGFYYTLEDLDCGPILRTNDELVDWIEHIDERFDKEKMLRFHEKFIGACDGHSCERLVEYIDQI